MKIHQIATAALLSVCLFSIAQADTVSDVWTTNTLGPAEGSFGTAGSVSSNTIDATITTDSSTANVSLSASNNSWFRTTGNVTNDELAPFFENDAQMTVVTLSSDRVLTNFDMLVHNVWYSSDDNQNFIGSFTVTHADGTIISNITPSVRAIFDDSPFATDFIGGTVQPTGLASDFDGANLLSMAGPADDVGNGAPLGRYLFDDSQSIFSEEQGSAILSFDESIHGGITEVEFVWVGHTIGANTAFIGFAGTVAAVPEPSGFVLLAMSAMAVLSRRRRAQSFPACAK